MSIAATAMAVGGSTLKSAGVAGVFVETSKINDKTKDSELSSDSLIRSGYSWKTLGSNTRYRYASELNKYSRVLPKANTLYRAGWWLSSSNTSSTRKCFAATASTTVFGVLIKPSTIDIGQEISGSPVTL